MIGFGLSHVMHQWACALVDDVDEGEDMVPLESRLEKYSDRSP